MPPIAQLLVRHTCACKPTCVCGKRAEGQLIQAPLVAGALDVADVRGDESYELVAVEPHVKSRVYSESDPRQTSVHEYVCQH